MAGKNILGEIHPVAKVHLDFLVEGGKFRHGNLIVPRIMLSLFLHAIKYLKSRGGVPDYPWGNVSDAFIQ